MQGVFVFFLIVLAWSRVNAGAFDHRETYQVRKACYAKKYHETTRPTVDIKDQKAHVGFTTLVQNVVFRSNFVQVMNEELGTDFDSGSFSSVFQIINYRSGEKPSSDPDKFLQGSTLDQAIQVPVSGEMNVRLRKKRNVFNYNCHVDILMKYFGRPDICVETIVFESENGGSVVMIIDDKPNIWYTLTLKQHGTYLKKVRKPKTHDVLDCDPATPFSFTWITLPSVEENSFVPLPFHPHESLGTTAEMDEEDKYTGTKRSSKRRKRSAGTRTTSGPNLGLVACISLLVIHMAYFA